MTLAPVPRIDGNMDVLEAHARSLRHVGPAIADTGERVFVTWQGLGAVYRAPEAGELLAAMGPVRNVAASLGEDIEAVGGALETYAGEVRAIQVRLDVPRAEIDAFYDSVDALGAPGVDVGLPPDGDAVAAVVAAAMADFEDAQRRCANTINALYRPGVVVRPPDADGVVEPGEYGSRPGSIAEVAAWWRGLSAAQRDGVLREHSDWVGNVDGIPAADRDRANRIALADESARLDSEIAVADARLGRLYVQLDATDPRLTGPIADEIAALVLARTALLDRARAADAVRDTLNQPERRLLLLDLSGDAPHAAVAIGDVDTATHVAVFTPGLATTVAGSLRGYDTDMNNVRDTAVRQLSKEPGRGGESVAVVTWIGYDPPQFAEIPIPSRSVLLPFDAADGGRRLSGFLDGIGASRVTDPHLTALGHSYGSTTTGYALQTASGVDDVVLFGSPGASTSGVADLNVPAGHLAVVEADGDPVADLGSFGSDPNRLDGVVGLGADPAVAPDGTALAGSNGHSEYLTRGTASQYSIAATVAGLPQNRVVTDPSGSSGFGDAFRGEFGPFSLDWLARP